METGAQNTGYDADGYQHGPTAAPDPFAGLDSAARRRLAYQGYAEDMDRPADVDTDSPTAATDEIADQTMREYLTGQAQGYDDTIAAIPPSQRQ